MNYKKSFWLVCIPEKDLQPHSPHLQSWELWNSWLRNWNTLSSHGSCFLWMQRASVKDWRGKVIPGDSPQHPNHAHVPSALPLNVSQVISKATILGQSTVNVLLDCSGLLSPTSVLDPPQSVLHAAAKGRLRDKWHHPTVLWVPSSAPRAAAIQSTFLMRPCPSISLPTTSFLWTHWFSAVSSDSPGSGLPQDLGTCCFLCKSCSSPSSNMTEALPPLTVCIPTLHTFCSSSHASQFNRHLSAFTMQTDLWGNDMTEVIQMVTGTAQERWHSICPQSLSLQPLDHSSWSHLASMPKFWPCSSLCWTGIAGMLLSQQQHWHTSPVCYHISLPF